MLTRVLCGESGLGHVKYGDVWPSLAVTLRVTVCAMPVLSFDSRQTISGSNVCVNTWHVSVNGQPLTSEATAICAAVKAFYDGHSAYRVTGTTVVTGSRVLYFQEGWWTKPTFDANGKLLTRGKFNTDPFIVPATPQTSTAGSGGGLLPPQLASVVSWRTATSGRSGRGRTYLGNLGNSALLTNAVTPAAVTAINSAAATLITAVAALQAAGASAALAVWSPTDGVLRPILSGATDATFDTMRSRVK